MLAQLYPATTAADDDSGWQPAWDARAHERTLAPLLSGFVRVRVRVRVRFLSCSLAAPLAQLAQQRQSATPTPSP